VTAGVERPSRCRSRRATSRSARPARRHHAICR
jgi:hypothetical protein